MPFTQTTCGKVINALLYQLGWLVCMFTGHYALWFSSAAIVVGIYLWQLNFSLKELGFISTVACAGYISDSLCEFSGLVSFTCSTETNLYLLCLWLMFSTTLRSSFSFFMGRPIYAVALGSIAPIAYIAGEKLDRLYYQHSLSILVHGTCWVVLMLVTYIVNRKLFHFEKPLKS